ncbi:MAG: DUF4446 family protein [Fimbriimonadaceae bacterium]|nr:DUF4446 family protein [Fimbriimonadaceae bacterium]QYK59636.1 MAG: DUF4446 family protein [Fimbriimonadaceae bacterium]
MDRLLDWISGNAGSVGLGLAVGFALILVVLIAQARAASEFRRRWAKTLESSDGSSLEQALEKSLAGQERLEAELAEARSRIESLETKMKSAKRYVGLVRYDAFEDIGGSQSFSLAVYDEEGNGAVVTSQVGREVCRVYGKQLFKGRAERHLSQEEERAIEAAVEGPTRPRISL